jgi:hypothetical protein
MAGNRSAATVRWVVEDVVSLAMSLEHTSCLFQLADKLLAFHTSSSTSLVCDGPGDPLSSSSSINSYASWMFSSNSAND